MSTFFSTDWHIGHTNVLEFDKRPFDNIDKHDETILANYNSIVGSDDDFYYLGDMFMNKNKNAEGFISRMMGKLHFIKGNHDHKDTRKLYAKYGEYLGQQEKIVIQDQEIILNHFPMRTWDKSHRGSWHLYGHHHGKIEKEPWGKSMDVAINIWDYKPVSFETVKSILDKRDIKHIPGDHHIERNK